MEICDVGLQCWNLTLPKNASLDIKVSIWDLRYSKNEELIHFTSWLIYSFSLSYI